MTVFGVASLEEWEREGIPREVGAVGASGKDPKTSKGATTEDVTWQSERLMLMAAVCAGTALGRRILKDKVVMQG